MPEAAAQAGDARWAMTRKNTLRVLATLGVGLAAGGLAGAGVANHLYGPIVGVALAVVVGVAVGLRVRQIKRENAESA